MEKLRGRDDLKVTLAIANAKLAHRICLEMFTGPDWDELARAGASPQHCLWASTSTKNPAHRDVRYVEELIGPGAVNTMPRHTIEAFVDHGHVADTLGRALTEAERTMDRFAEASMDNDDLTAVLEREGVAKFDDSYRRLFDCIEVKRDELRRS